LAEVFSVNIVMYMITLKSFWYVNLIEVDRYKCDSCHFKL
jgi:hypothetical protein